MQIYNYGFKVNPLNTTSGFQVSSKYQNADSRKIIEQLGFHGFELKDTSFGPVRNQAKQGFQKHIMIFEKAGCKIDDENSMHLLVTNSHDKSSSLKFNIGVFRTVCANGLVVGDNYFEYSIRHIGDGFLDRIDQGIKEVTETLPLIAEQVNAMKSYILTDNQVMELKDKTAEIRGLEVYSPETIRSMRPKDQGNSLYNVFNVCQEKLIRGGIRYFTTDEQDLPKQSVTREIKSIGTKNQYNKQLWNYAIDIVA